MLFTLFFLFFFMLSCFYKSFLGFFKFIWFFTFILLVSFVVLFFQSFIHSNYHLIGVVGFFSNISLIDITFTYKIVPFNLSCILLVLLISMLVQLYSLIICIWILFFRVFYVN